jgi:hypothetical protein
MPFSGSVNLPQQLSEVRETFMFTHLFYKGPR